MQLSTTVIELNSKAYWKRGEIMPYELLKGLYFETSAQELSIERMHAKKLLRTIYVCLKKKLR